MTYKFGTDYGKDLLADLNALAHRSGTDAVMRDALQRAYAEIVRLRKFNATITDRGKAPLILED